MAGYTEEQVKLASIYSQLRHIGEAATDLYSTADYTDSVTFDRDERAGSSAGIVFGYDMAYANALQRPSSTACAYMNEFQLSQLRARSRAFCSLNPYWMAVRENKINYAVGTGHVVSVVAKRNGEKVPKELAWKVQDEIDKFTKVNRYRQRQGEKLTRLDRDGEYFLWFDETKDDGVLRVRFIEPLLVSNPPGVTEQQGVIFGIGYAARGATWDYEEPVRYYVKSVDYHGATTGDMLDAWVAGVDAEEILHRTANVDINSPRGLPTTYALQEPCTQAVSTRKSMGRLVDIRARLAVIVKNVNATLGQIQPLLARNRIGQATGQGGKMLNVFGMPYGTVLNTNDQRTYELPSQNIETDKIVHSLKADLQSVAAAMGLADFTLSADSSSSFANSLVKEGPMDRAIGRVQQDLIDDDIAVYERVLEVAASKQRLPRDILDTIRLDITPPGVIARDRLVSTQADEILVRNGAMSPDTMAMRANLDPADEREKAKANPSPQVVGSGDTRSNQPGMGKATARAVPKHSEPGPGANSNATKEGLEESSHDTKSSDKPTTEDMAMADILLPYDWREATKAQILGLPISGGPPRSTGIRTEYEPGIESVYLGLVDGLAVYAVDTAAVMVKHDCCDFVVAGNSTRYPWIPDNVILVDWNYPLGDMAHNLYHEVVEWRCQNVGKWSYARAHRVAGSLEREWLISLRPELVGNSS